MKTKIWYQSQELFRTHVFNKLFQDTWVEEFLQGCLLGWLHGFQVRNMSRQVRNLEDQATGIWHGKTKGWSW